MVRFRGSVGLRLGLVLRLDCRVRGRVTVGIKVGL